MQVEKLGKYQIEWLNKYYKIDLSEWRCEIEAGDKKVKSEWYYIGGNDVIGFERKNNLHKDPYFYWPKEKNK